MLLASERERGGPRQDRPRTPRTETTVSAAADNEAERQCRLARLDAFAGLLAHLEGWRLDVMVHAILEASPAHWLRRAETFEWAKPRPDEITPDNAAEQRERWQRCHESAAACRRHAEIVSGLLPPGIEQDVAYVLGEAS